MLNCMNQSTNNDSISVLQYQLSFHKLLGSIFSRFHSSHYDQMDEAIDETLQDIGQFVSADRAYLFLISDDDLYLNNTHEWCAEDISCQKEFLQHLNLAEYEWTIERLSKCDYFYIPSVENALSLSRKVKAILTIQQIQSLLLVALKRGNKFYGYLGFDAVTKPRDWSSEDISLLMFVSDIILWAREHKRSEDSLRVFQQLFNSIEEALLVFSEIDKVSWMNQAFTKITGYTYEDIIGKPFSMLIADGQSVFDEILGFLEEHGKWSGTIIGKHKDGHTFPASLFISTSLDKNENITRYLVVFNDITEFDRLEKERARLEKQTVTAQKLHSLSAMSAAMVHEIAQPFNAIKVLVDGMLYCNKHNYELPRSEIMLKLEEVSTEVKRIEEIIQSIRSFASSNQSLELTPCSWNGAFERVLGLLGRQMAKHQVTIIPDLHTDMPRMYANPLRLDEVLINLLVNAMNALDYSEKADKEIICSTSFNEKLAIMEVSDNACGIDENLQEMIFEPFYTDHHNSQGMGLGLSVVASIMASLNGQVTVFNNDKGGATFRLELPIIQEDIKK